MQELEPSPKKKKLPMILTIAGVAFALYAIVLELIRLTPLDPREVWITPLGAMVAASFLVLGGLFVFMIRSQQFQGILSPRNLFWAVVLLATGIIWTVSTIPLQRMGELASVKLSRKVGLSPMNQFYYAHWLHAEEPSFLGVPILQSPNDNWMMQEIITEIKPDYIIETGTLSGGASLYYAIVLNQVNPDGKVITVDVYPDIDKAEDYPIFREKVITITGDSVSPEVLAQIEDKVRGKVTMVTLDSDHSKEHVLRELELYSKLVTVGSYLVVQDTNIDYYQIENENGPWEAVKAFLKDRDDFVIDEERSEKYLISFYPSGYLKKIK